MIKSIKFNSQSDFSGVIELIYFNDSRDRATDSEFLVDDAVLLGQPVDAVIALTHPTKQDIL